MSNGEKIFAVIKRGFLYFSDSSRKALKYLIKYIDLYKRLNIFLALLLFIYRKFKYFI